MTVRIFLVVIAAFVTTHTIAGDLKIRFEYEGPAFEPAPIDVRRGVAFCANQNLIDETLIVNPKNKGIKNVVVYVYTGRGGAKIPPVEPSSDTRALAYQNCRFAPHILTMQAGDTLKIINRDPVGHNANLNFLRNGTSGRMIPRNNAEEISLDEAEPAPIPVECNIHPWMKAYVVILDHPYVGVSNDDGDLVIEGLPEENLTFRVWVEAASGALTSVRINGVEQHWSRNRFEYPIKAGENDMGTVTLTADQLAR
jgi:plastocyanin